MAQKYKYIVSKNKFFIDFLKHIDAIYPFFRNIQLHKIKEFGNYSTNPSEILYYVDKIEIAFVWSKTIEGKLYWRIVNGIGNFLLSLLSDHNNRRSIDSIIELVNARIENLLDSYVAHKDNHIDSLIKRINKYIKTRYAKFLQEKQLYGYKKLF